MVCSGSFDIGCTTEHNGAQRSTTQPNPKVHVRFHIAYLWRDALSMNHALKVKLTDNSHFVGYSFYRWREDAVLINFVDCMAGREISQARANFLPLTITSFMKRLVRLKQVNNCDLRLATFSKSVRRKKQRSSDRVSLISDIYSVYSVRPSSELPCR